MNLGNLNIGDAVDDFNTPMIPIRQRQDDQFRTDARAMLANRYSLESYARAPLGSMQNPSNAPDQSSILQAKKRKEALVHKREKKAQYEKLRKILLKEKIHVIVKIKQMMKIQKEEQDRALALSMRGVQSINYEDLEVYDMIIQQYKRESKSIQRWLQFIANPQRDQTFSFSNR